MFTEIGQWENFLGTEMKKIAFPNGLGAIVEKTGKTFRLQPTLNGIATFEIFTETNLDNLNSEEVENLLGELAI